MPDLPVEGQENSGNFAFGLEIVSHLKTCWLLITFWSFFVSHVGFHHFWLTTCLFSIVECTGSLNLTKELTILISGVHQIVVCLDTDDITYDIQRSDWSDCKCIQRFCLIGEYRIYSCADFG